MTHILFSKGEQIPVLIDTMGRNALYIELRVFDENGIRIGAVHNVIDREDARTLANGILRWLDATEERKVAQPIGRDVKCFWCDTCGNKSDEVCDMCVLEVGSDDKPSDWKPKDAPNDCDEGKE